MTHPAIELLEHEHRVIEWVLEALEATNRSAPEWGVYERAISFLASYIEGVHHDLEENYLFQAMTEAGVSGDRGPIGCMREDHVDSHTLLDGMRQALSAMDPQAIREASGAYCVLLREHIAKEDNIVYPMAEGKLSAETLSQVEGAMRERLDSIAEHSRLESLAARLRRSTVNR